MSVFNCEPYLREAVDSILVQTFTDFEFIIVNDGSSDGTAAVLNAYAQNDSRIQVAHQENRGAAESWNRGCRLARGKYIARMDGDDTCVATRLEKQVEFLEKHDEVGVLGGEFEFVDVNGNTLGVQHMPLKDHEIRACFPDKSSILHATVLMRKAIFDAVGGYRRAFDDTADYDLWLRMGKLCELANLPEVLYRYRTHPSQVTYRRVKRQALSYLAAGATFPGGEDYLASAREVTPELLAKLGVSEAVIERSLATFYRNETNMMCWAGQTAAALELVLEMLRSSRWEHIENRKRFLSDNWLRAAGLHWEQRQYASGLAAITRAVMMRPMVAGRPIKKVLDRMRDAARAQSSPAAR